MAIGATGAIELISDRQWPGEAESLASYTSCGRCPRVAFVRSPDPDLPFGEAAEMHWQSVKGCLPYEPHWNSVRGYPQKGCGNDTAHQSILLIGFAAASLAICTVGKCCAICGSLRPTGADTRIPCLERYCPALPRLGTTQAAGFCDYQGARSSVRPAGGNAISDSDAVSSDVPNR